MTRVEQVPARKWHGWAEDNEAQIVDVREPEEWAQGTLPESIEMRLATIPQAMASLDPDRAVLVVCRSGNRSNMAAAFLARAGFSRVANLAGGLQALGLAQ